MKTSVATLGVGVLVVLATAWPSRSQGPDGKEARKAAAERESLTSPREHELWRQKAEIELALLEAQVEAKRAEIKRGDAEYRMRQLAPTFALLAKLDRPVALHFPNETPLEDVLKFIKSATSDGPGDPGLPIYVDPVGLQEAGKTLASTVNIDLEDIPLKTTLRLILKQVGLAYRAEDGLLTITADESLRVPLEGKPAR
jgi:hypothetical protein